MDVCMEVGREAAMDGRKEGGMGGGRERRVGERKILRQRMTDRWTEWHKVHILFNSQTHALKLIISYTSSAS